MGQDTTSLAIDCMTLLFLVQVIVTIQESSLASSHRNSSLLITTVLHRLKNRCERNSHELTHYSPDKPCTVTYQADLISLAFEPCNLNCTNKDEGFHVFCTVPRSRVL
ncbi:hypothetical protein NC651_017847 [Populus alba x Populus x berolinensis]|nr:hypothetical protein NC651_017847 [Populus alba x Populus x berolinensis]